PPQGTRRPSAMVTIGRGECIGGPRTRQGSRRRGRERKRSGATRRGSSEEVGRRRPACGTIGVRAMHSAARPGDDAESALTGKTGLIKGGLPLGAATATPSSKGREMSLNLVRWSGPLVGALALLAASGCGGGGGGKKSVNPLDPTIQVFGSASGGTARLSRTPDEANTDGGTNPPPSMSPDSNGANQWFRLEFPFAIDRTTILDKNQIFVPFDNLNGNITVSDLTGDHVPGLALVGGRDVNGVNHATDVGFPHDVQSGVDRNTLPTAFVFIANVDYDLATTAAFGYEIDAITQKRKEVTAATVDTVRITVAEVNGFSFDAVWTFHIGVANDAFPPLIVRAASEIRDPLQPTNPDSASVSSAFIVEFSKPVVPRTVGTSALLD